MKAALFIVRLEKKTGETFTCFDNRHLTHHYMIHCDFMTTAIWLHIQCIPAFLNLKEKKVFYKNYTQYLQMEQNVVLLIHSR